MNSIKTVFSIVVLMAAFLSTRCSKDNPTEPEDNFTSVTGEYFGQTPPGMQATRFAVAEFLANDEWFWHGSPVFSPDGREVYFGIYQSDNQIKIFFSEMIDDRWTVPQSIPFASEDATNNPVFSGDGNTLYFISHVNTRSIFRVTRTETGWSVPEALNIPIPQGCRIGWQFSMTRNGKIYFELWENGGATPPDIWVTESINGSYSAPIKLGDSINTAYSEFSPFVHPDDDYILFLSNRPGGAGMHDIYVSFHQTDGSWSDAIHIGNQVNSTWEDGSPWLSPDGDYLFFTTMKTGDQGYNPYWISSQVIDDLRPTDSETLRDYEGNTYQTVEIGNQVWMEENLKTTRTYDGAPLSGVYVYDNNESNVAEYGRLYTLQAALNAAPQGWHLPTDEDWNILESALGSEPGTQLKEGGSSGYNAKMAGYRGDEGEYANMGWWTIFWSSTPYTNDHNYVRNLFSDQTGIVRSGTPNNTAVSVRYVKD